MPRTHNAPPDLTTHFGRLRWAREEAGYSSSRGAAQAFGWGENRYKSHEQGERQKDGFKVDTAKTYARAFGVAQTWLMTGRGSPRPSPADAEWAEMGLEERERALRLLRAAG